MNARLTQRLALGAVLCLVAADALAQYSGGVNVTGNINPTQTINRGVLLLALIAGALISGYWLVVGLMHLRGRAIAGDWIIGGLIGTAFIAGGAFIGGYLMSGGGLPGGGGSI